jgi:hypothetical protein
MHAHFRWPRDIRSALPCWSLLVLLLMPLLAGAQEGRTYAIRSFDVTVAVQPDGTYAVREDLLLRFTGGTFGEGFRNIPTGRLAARLDPVRVSRIQVTSPDVEVRDVRLRTTRRESEITWRFPPHEGDARFTLRYTVEGGLGLAQNRNLVDWDAVGSAWEVPLEAVSVRLQIPTFGLDRDAFETSPEPTTWALLPPEGLSGADEPARWPLLELHYEVGSIPARTPYRVVTTFPQQIALPEPSHGEAASSGLLGMGTGPFVLGLLAALLAGLIAPLSWVFHTWTRRPPVQKQGLAPPAFPLAWLARLDGRLYWADAAVMPTLVRMAREGHLTLEATTAPATAVAAPSPPTTPPPSSAPSSPAPGPAPAPEPAPAPAPARSRASSRATALGVRLHARPDELPWSHVMLLKLLAQDPAIANLRRQLRGVRDQVEREMEEAGLLESLHAEARRMRWRGAVLELGGVGLGVALGVSGMASGAVVAMILVFSIVCGGGLMLASLRDWRLTPKGAEIRARHRAFARSLRADIRDDLRRRPERARENFVAHLELLLGTAHHAPLWLHRLNWKRAGGAPELPSWLGSLESIRAVGSEGKPTDPTGFLPVYFILWNSSVAGGLAQHGKTPSPGMPGMPGGAGIGASGGFGGGGGGFR